MPLEKKISMNLISIANARITEVIYLKVKLTNYGSAFRAHKLKFSSIGFVSVSKQLNTPPH
jgi:hypothetical protein